MSSQTSRSPARINAGLFLSLLLLLAAVLACSSGSSAKKCTATLTNDGKTFVGEGSSTDDATRFACNKYCREADPGYEAMYGVWLDSPAGKAAGRPSKEEAIYKDKKLMDYVTVTCANECLTKVKDGKAQAETKCE
ncbi:MAG TPA: hypothetical protein VGC60_12575 [Pyrinomonadaceae bacterium]|jgi:hypothetical protein